MVASNSIRVQHQDSWDGFILMKTDSFGARESTEGVQGALWGGAADGGLNRQPAHVDFWPRLLLNYAFNYLEYSYEYTQSPKTPPPLKQVSVDIPKTRT